MLAVFLSLIPYWCYLDLNQSTSVLSVIPYWTSNANKLEGYW